MKSTAAVDDTNLQEVPGIGPSMDRCLLYVFRCAVYFAEESRHDPELLKWWNWTDERRPVTRRAEKGE